jgi:transcriptional regulator with XRE-family HTH domain
MEPTFAERLTSWLSFVGMRPARLASTLGVSKTAIHNWTNGHIEPGTDRIVPICNALGITVAEFFSRMPREDAGLNAEREAQQAREAESTRPHPGTGDITRELDAAAIDRALGLKPDEPCPTCGRTDEAA